MLLQEVCWPLRWLNSEWNITSAFQLMMLLKNLHQWEGWQQYRIKKNPKPKSWKNWADQAAFVKTATKLWRCTPQTFTIVQRSSLGIPMNLIHFPCSKIQSTSQDIPNEYFTSKLWVGHHKIKLKLSELGEQVVLANNNYIESFRIISLYTDLQHSWHNVRTIEADGNTQITPGTAPTAVPGVLLFMLFLTKVQNTSCVAIYRYNGHHYNNKTRLQTR